MRFTVSQISWRRANQLRDLVAMLKLRAIDLDDSTRVLEQRFRRRLNNSGLARTGGTKEQKVSNGPAWGIHPREMHLVDVDDMLNRLILPDDHSSETRLQSARLATCLRGVQRDVKPYHFICHLSLRRAHAAFRSPPQIIRQP